MRTRAADQEARHSLTRCNKSLNRNDCAACPFRKVKLKSTGQEIKVEGQLNCKTKCFLYLLWSRKAEDQVYLGSSCREPREWFGEHRRDIENNWVEKAVPQLFVNTHSYVEDLVFRPIKRVKLSCRWVLRHFETRLINMLNLVEAGVNRVLS